MIKLSIIVPVFNGEKYIHELLEDILKLNLVGYEVILVNDGSTDSTLKILENYSSKHEQIKPLSQQNRGVSSARNYGLKKAKGRYVMFLDADDRINPVEFEKFYNKSIQHGAQYSFTGYIEENFKTCKKKTISTFGEEYYELVEFMDVFFENLKLNIISYPINKIFLKSVIDCHDLKFDENIHFAEDLLFNLDYLIHIDTVYVGKDNYYIYRKYSNETSLSSNFEMQFWASRKLVYNKLQNFYRRVNLDKYKREVNTYATNAMLYTITQIIESNVKFKQKVLNINQIINDDYTKKLLLEKSFFSNSQIYFLKAVRTKSPLVVYLTWKLYFLKLKIIKR